MPLKARSRLRQCRVNEDLIIGIGSAPQLRRLHEIARMSQLVDQCSEQRIRRPPGAAREAGGGSAQYHLVIDQDERSGLSVDREFHGHTVRALGDDLIVDELVRRTAVLHRIRNGKKRLPQIDGAAVGGDAQDLPGVERVCREAAQHMTPGV